MNNDRYIHIGYRSSDDSMKRVITIPLGFSIIMCEGRMYNFRILQEGRQVESFGEVRMHSSSPSWSLTKKIYKIFKIC